MRFKTLQYGAAVCLITAVACDGGNGTTGVQDNRELGRLRFVHAVSDVATIDYFIDGNVEFSDQPVGSTSSYVSAKVDALVAVVDGATGDVLTTGGLNLVKDLRFTALTTKAGAETTLLVYSHVGAEPASNQTRFRFMNGAPNAGVLRIEIDAPGSSVPVNVVNLQPQDVFEPVLTGQATAYVEGDPGDYTFTAFSAGGVQLVQSQATQLEANSGWTIVIFDDGLAGTEVDMDLLDDLNELVAVPLTPMVATETNNHGIRRGNH
ncbi:MAG: DUF4397 domain-containing protein [Gemmatimonadota bacterium]|nr:MAG: DUF4397 domain-containing protein [Gemmatimonadota bacterium]